MTTAARPNTPGYNSHLDIWFAHDKRGRKAAYYFSCLAVRAIRMPLADAELFIATGQATKVSGHPFKA